MTKTGRNSIIALVAVAVIAVGGYYAFAHKTPGSGNVAPVEGAASQTELSQATASLRSAIEAAEGASFDFQAQPTYGHYANFGIVQQVNEVKSVGLVDEMALTFRGKTDNENAEVDPKTGQVIAFHREVEYGSAAKTQAQLEVDVRAFLAKVYPSFAQIEPTLTFENNSKTGRSEGSNIFFTWNDTNYQKQLPDGIETERAPFVQVGITSSGYIFSYNNTIDLYRNALKEFSVTQ